MNYMPLLYEDQLQTDRLARAQSALQRGEMTIRPAGANTWAVVSKGNPYTVCLEGETWSCTCPDFTGRCQRYGLLCKHILAVRFSAMLEASTGKANINDMEVHMTKNASPAPVEELEPGSPVAPGPQPGQDPNLNPDRIARLRQPLDMSRVKRRQASGQGTVPYIEGYQVIESANDLFEFEWSFDLLGEPRIMRWDKVVTFYDQHTRKKVPVLGEDGKPALEVSGIVYVAGRITVELNGKPFSHADVGRCIFNGDSPEALDMALAGAATDCLKRCFRQLGERFGLSLYDKEVAKTAGLENGSSSGSTVPGNGSNGHPPARKAPTQPGPSSPGPEIQRYGDGEPVETSNLAEVNAFKAFQTAHQDRDPASRQELRTWISQNNGKK